MWVRVATFEGRGTEKLDKLMGERMSSGATLGRSEFDASTAEVTAASAG